MPTSVESQSLASRVLKTELVQWKTFIYIQQDEFKELPRDAAAKLKASILANQFTQPFYVWQDEKSGAIYCLDGRHRTLMLQEMINEGHKVPDKLPATFIQCKDKQEAAKLVLVYSSIYAKITEQGMFDFVKMYDLDFTEMKSMIDLPAFDNLDFESRLKEESSEVDPIVPRSLQERFIIPPFSIFDSRQGYWQERKKQWHALGFDSQATREDVELVAKSGQSPAVYELRNKMREALGRDPEWDEILDEARKRGLHIYEGASIFDPVICEVCYSWFCPPGGTILDPFAGGSVRGIVAGVMGLSYTGIDLRVDQVWENRKQWNRLKNGSDVTWIDGDSNVVLEKASDEKSFDFIFSCPPYHDLEQYSDDPADLSNMDYPEFLDVYRSIIAKSVARLKDNRFACFVVGDIRDKSGFYRDFVGDTVQAFRDAGAEFYNEIILVNVAGSLPVRIGRQFEGYRKVGKMHQNILVFYKGDPKKIKEEFPEIKVPKDLISSE